MLIASDGPRLAPTGRRSSRRRAAAEYRPLGRTARGRAPLGQLGRPMANPGIMLATRWRGSSTTARRDPVREWRPTHPPNSVRIALADCAVDAGPDAPTIDPSGASRGSRRARRCSAGAASRCSRSTTATPTIRSTRSRRTQGDLPDPLCRRHRSRALPAGAAPPSAMPRLSDGQDRAWRAKSSCRRRGSTPSTPG